MGFKQALVGIFHDWNMRPLFKGATLKLKSKENPKSGLKMPKWRLKIENSAPHLGDEGITL